MSVSKRLRILPLGLLIIVTGCSSNRLQQIFAPDREFMALNELDQNYDGQGARQGRSEESLASRSKDIGEHSNDQKSQRFFSIGRWINPGNTDSIPPDPFLAMEQFNPPANDNRVVVVGHSNELENREAGELLIENEKNQQPLNQETAETDSTDQRGRLPTFADVLAEFEEADENSDELDALAEEWLAEETMEDGTSDFGVLTTDAMKDSASAREADSDDPTLDFNVSDERLFFEDSEEPGVKLAETDGNLEGFEGLLENHNDSTSSDPFGDEQDYSPATDHVFNNESSIDESLWESSDSIVGWGHTEPKNDKSSHRLETIADQGRKKKLDFSRPTKVTASGVQRQKTTRAAMGLVAAAGEPATATEKMPFRVKAAEIGSQISSDDPFLSDFEKETPEATSPAVASNTGFISNVSPRTWLMLLGGVVIAYLLFAPERKNLRQPNNR